MSIHQILLGSGLITYTKGFTLLNTATVDTPIIVTAPWFTHVFYNGVVWDSKQAGGVAVGMDLFSFSGGNTPIVNKTGLFPQRFCVGGAYGKSTPPGYGIYLEVGAQNVIYRINADGIWESVALGISATSAVMVWENSQQSMFFISGGNTVNRIASLNWALGTCTLNSVTYNTTGYTAPRIIPNGGLIDSRVYVYESSGGGRIGWVHASTGVFTSVITYTNAIGDASVSASPILCSPDFIGSSAIIATQCGTTNQGNYVDFYNTAGSLVGHVQLPLESNTTYGNYQLSYDYVNNYLFVKASTRAVYVINMTTYTLIDTYTSAEMPDSINFYMGGNLGSPAGGVYIISRPSGVVYNTIYKLG